MAPSQTQLRPDRTASAAPERPRRRRGTFWTALAAVEVLLGVVAVLLNLTSFPTFVILGLAGISLALRREGLATLGFRGISQLWRMAVTVLGLVVGWGLLSLGVLRPVLTHLTGTTEDLSAYANLQGNLGMLAGLLLITWTVAAFGEELAYRGFLQTRITDVLGRNLVGTVAAVVVSSVLFGLAHTEYGIVGVAVTFLDALFFSALRLRYRTLWASILAHGLWNTLGIVGFFLVGPVNGFW